MRDYCEILGVLPTSSHSQTAHQLQGESQQAYGLSEPPARRQEPRSRRKLLFNAQQALLSPDARSHYGRYPLALNSPGVISLVQTKVQPAHRIGFAAGVETGEQTKHKPSIFCSRRGLHFATRELFGLRNSAQSVVASPLFSDPFAPTGAIAPPIPAITCLRRFEYRRGAKRALSGFCSLTTMRSSTGSTNVPCECPTYSGLKSHDRG